MPAGGREPRKGSAARGRSRPGSTAAESSAWPNGAPASAAGLGQLVIDLDFVRGLIAAVDESGIDTLEINRAGTRIRISKTPTVNSVTGGVSFAQPAAQALPALPDVNAVTGAPSAQTTAADEARKSFLEVPSPMVGTFYRAPAPEAPAYVEVGSHVTKGQTLCILEAMKLMNELDSDVDGVVREILVANGDPVEYGEVLFRIEPAGPAT